MKACDLTMKKKYPINEKWNPTPRRRCMVFPWEKETGERRGMKGGGGDVKVVVSGLVH